MIVAIAGPIVENLERVRPPNIEPSNPRLNAADPMLGLVEGPAELAVGVAASASPWVDAWTAS